MTSIITYKCDGCGEVRESLADKWHEVKVSAAEWYAGAYQVIHLCDGCWITVPVSALIP